MDLKIPNIVRPIELKEYADEFGDAVIWVWVNPTRELRISLSENILNGEPTEEQIGAWFSEIWSQGSEDTRFTPEDVIKLANDCMERDPRLWIWLINKTIELLSTHYSTKKKSLNTPQ
jgi:hypothetical protein